MHHIGIAVNDQAVNSSSCNCLAPWLSLRSALSLHGVRFSHPAYVHIDIDGQEFALIQQLVALQVQQIGIHFYTANIMDPEDIRLMAQQGLPDPITKKLNDVTVYDSWYSSHAQSLSYLVGTPTDSAKSRGSNSVIGRWYGKDVEIPDEEGTEILKMMVKLGAQLNIHNFYGETMYETITQLDKISGREDNELFKEYF